MQVTTATTTTTGVKNAKNNTTCINPCK